jgi:transposase
MAGPYSRDLRGRVSAAMEAGETPEAAARRFAVGRSTAHRWAAAARDEGRRAAKPMRGGPAARITGEVEAAMPGLAGGPDHPSLAEIAARRGSPRRRACGCTRPRCTGRCGGPGRMDVKEAEPARRRAGPRGRGPGT